MADAGYCSEDNLLALATRKIHASVATGRAKHAWRTGGLLRGSGGAVCQRRLHGRAGLEGAEDLHRCDRGARASLGVTSLAMVARPNLDVERCPGIAGRLKILPRVVRQPELELPARHRLTDCVVLPFELVSNGCADEVSTISVEAIRTIRSTRPRSMKPRFTAKNLFRGARSHSALRGEKPGSSPSSTAGASGR